MYVGRVVHRHAVSIAFIGIQTVLPIMYIFSRLLFGLLYPAYASYKAVKTKNVKEYVSTSTIVSNIFFDTETCDNLLCPFNKVSNQICLAKLKSFWDKRNNCKQKKNKSTKCQNLFFCNLQENTVTRNNLSKLTSESEGSQPVELNMVENVVDFLFF